MQAFFALHHNIPREGPGSDISTHRAIEKLQPLSYGSTILDVGCGPGRQSLILARQLDCPVTAIDIHQPFLDRLNAEAVRQGLESRILSMNVRMEAMPFPEACFDLIWAEGSAFILGVSQSLKVWKRLLKSNGQIGFTELTWLIESPPTEAAQFWAKNYPPMTTVEENRRQIEAEGFNVLDTFILPTGDWWDEYLTPLGNRVELLRHQATNDAELGAVLAGAEMEISICSRFGASFGYVFYIAKKR